MGQEWEDKYLLLKQENERLKDLQRDQAQREHKIASRLVSLKEQQLALQEGRAVAGDAPREAKLAELQQALHTLEKEHVQLTHKLQAHKTGAKPGSPAARRLHVPGAQDKQQQQPKDHHQPKDVHGDGHGEGAQRAQLVVAQLKREILETNLALAKLKEQSSSYELQDSLAQFHVGHSGATEHTKEREELKRELKTKEAKYTLAKSKLDALDKEYKDYVAKHKQLLNQAEETQRAIFDQQKQQRTLEAQIKQLKLQKDQESDMKSILDDMREELTLLKEENRRLQEDNLSGQSLATRSAHHGAEVEKLSSDRTELSAMLVQQQERDIALRKKLEEKRLLQRRLENERAEKQALLDTLRNTHQELTRSLDNFSLSPLDAQGDGDGVAAKKLGGGTEGGEKAGMESDFPALLGRLKEHLSDRGYSAADCFKQWNKKSDGLLIEREAVEGLMASNLGLQHDDARRLFAHMVQEPQQNPEEPAITQADFDKIISSAKAPTEAGPGDTSALQSELRKLRGVNAELLREKDEWIRKLKARESSTKASSGGSGGQEVSAEARVRALEAEYGAELQRLEGLLAIAEMNQKDLQAMKAAAPKRIAAQAAVAAPAPGDVARPMRDANTVIVEIHGVSLEREAFSQEPTTFLSLDFYAHETQNTYPATGLDVELGWSCEFVVEVDEVLLSYLEREPLRIDLMERVSQTVPFRRVATSTIDLKSLLDDKPMDRRRADLLKDASGKGARIGKVDVSIRLGQPLAPSVLALRAPTSKVSKPSSHRAPAPPFLLSEQPPYKLSISVVRAEKLRSSRYGHLPSPYVQYAFPTGGGAGEPHLTATSPGTNNPVWGDERSWELATDADVASLRGQDMEVLVLDDDDEGDDEAGLIGVGRLSLGAFVDKQEGGEVRVALKGLDGGPSGTLTMAVKWVLQRAAPASTPAPGATPAKDAKGGKAAPQVPAAQRVPVATAPKLAAKKALTEEQEWLETLSDRFAELGWPIRKIFQTFDIDGDDEVSWNDFKEAIANEPLKLTADQQKQLFEYWAGDPNKNITMAAFESGLKKDQAPSEFKKDHVGLLLRELTITNPKILADLPPRVCVLLDFFKQPPDQELTASKPIMPRRRGNTPAKAPLSEALALSLDSRATRSRVKAALDKDSGDGWGDITVMVCKVSDKGAVDTDNWLAKASVDVLQLLSDGKDLKSFNLQMLDSAEKPSATLMIDSHLVPVLKRVMSEGVGALPGKGTRAAQWQEEAAGELAKVLAGKGMSVRAAFQMMDTDCDGLITSSDFCDAMANEAAFTTDPSRRPEVFAYISDNKDECDMVTWEARMSRVGGSGVVLTQADSDAKEAVVVLVKVLKLRSEVQTRLLNKYKLLSVEADFFRQPASQKLSSTEKRTVSEGVSLVNFNDKLSLNVKKDATEPEIKGNRQRVQEAVESESSRATVEIQVVAHIKEDSTGDVVGSGTIDVGAMWKEQEELRDFSLQVVDDNGRPLGSLSVDCLAIQALRTLSLTRHASSSRGAASSAGGASSTPSAAAGTGGLGLTRSPSTAKAAMAAGVAGSFHGKQDGEGKVWVRVDEIRSDDLAEDMSGGGWSVTCNFLGQQSEREEARQRSETFPLTSFRPAKPKHTLSFGVSKGRMKANLEALQTALESDETEGGARVTITLGKEPVGTQYAKDGVIAIAKATCSLADALHARVEGAASALELPLTFLDGPRKGEAFGTANVSVGFDDVFIRSVEGRAKDTKKEEEEGEECLVVWGDVLDIGAKGAAQDRTLRQAEKIVLEASSMGGGVLGRSRAMRLKDDGGHGLPRPRLAVNHKWVFKGEGLQSAMQSGKVKVSLIDVGARREEELGDGEIDIKALSSGGKRDHAVSLQLQSSKSKLAILNLHVTLPPAGDDKEVVGAKGGKAGDGKKLQAGRDAIVVTIEAFSLEDQSLVLKNSKYRRLMGSVQWFGEDVEEHQTRELDKTSFVSVDKSFLLNLKDKGPVSKTPFRDLLHESLAKGDEGEAIEIVLWGISGTGKDEESTDIAVGKISDKELIGPEDSSVWVTLKAAEKGGEDPKGRVKVRIKAHEAVGSLRFRGPSRPVPVAQPDKGMVSVVQDGSRLSKERDKETHIVCAAKSLQLAGPLLQGGKSYGHVTKVFLGVNFFGTSQALAAVAQCGAEAQVVRAIVEPDCKFMCPVDVAHSKNREILKAQVGDAGGGLSVDLYLFKEPWESTDVPLASGSISHAELVEGQDVKVDLMDEGTLLGSVLVQVFYQEAFKTLGVNK